MLHHGGLLRDGWNLVEQNVASFRRKTKQTQTAVRKAKIKEEALVLEYEQLSFGLVSWIPHPTS